MKICFFCDSLFSFGGVQRVLAVIAKALAAHHEVSILTLDDPHTEDRTMYGLSEAANIRYRYLRFPPSAPCEYYPHKAFSYLYKNGLPHNKFTSQCYGRSSFPRSARRTLINELNREGGYDVIIGVHVFLSLRLATIRHDLKARKVIGWMHNSYQAFFEHTPAYLGKVIKDHFRHQMQRLDEVVVLTHTDAAIYRQVMGLDFQVIYNPLTLRPQGQSNPQAKKFLAVGRFSPRHKGFDILIEAFARFAQTNAEWCLEIVGEGPEEPQLRALIARYELERRITLCPFTKNIQAHYAGASVYVLSSRWEGFPLVLAEAMAHGLPIISSDIPTGVELLQDKNFALLFTSEHPEALCERMVEMSRSTQLQTWSDQAREFAKEMTVEKAVEKWEEIIQ